MEKKELTESIHNELRVQGIIKTVKTLLKAEICQTLVQETPSVLKEVRRMKSLEQAAVRSLVMECIVSDGLEYSQSIYLMESGLDGYRLSIRDILKAFEIQRGSRLYELLVLNKDKERERECKGVQNSAIFRILTSFPKIGTDAPKRTSHTPTQTYSHEFVCSKKSGIDSKISSLELPGDARQLDAKGECRMRESEGNVGKHMELQFENFNRTAMVVMKQDLAQSYARKTEEALQVMKIKSDKSLEMMKKEEERLKKEFIRTEIMREHQHSAELLELKKEIESFKKSENENASVINIEKRKLQLEKQRVKHMMMNAEAKLEIVEMKERNNKEATMQTSSDASEAVKKQTACYVKEIRELNVLRENLYTQLKNSELMQTEASKVRVENGKLRNKYDRVVAESEKFKSSSDKKQRKILNHLHSLKEQNIELETKSTRSTELVQRYKTAMASALEEYKNKTLAMESQLDFLHHELIEKNKLISELEDTLVAFSGMSSHMEIGCCSAMDLPKNDVKDVVYAQETNSDKSFTILRTKYKALVQKSDRTKRATPIDELVQNLKLDVPPLNESVGTCKMSSEKPTINNALSATRMLEFDDFDCQTKKDAHKTAIKLDTNPDGKRVNIMTQNQCHTEEIYDASRQYEASTISQDILHKSGMFRLEEKGFRQKDGSTMNFLSESQQVGRKVDQNDGNPFEDNCVSEVPNSDLILLHPSEIANNNNPPDCSSHDDQSCSITSSAPRSCESDYESSDFEVYSVSPVDFDCQSNLF